MGVLGMVGWKGLACGLNYTAMHHSPRHRQELSSDPGHRSQLELHFQRELAAPELAFERAALERVHCRRLDPGAQRRDLLAGVCRGDRIDEPEVCGGHHACRIVGWRGGGRCRGEAPVGRASAVRAAPPRAGVRHAAFRARVARWARRTRRYSSLTLTQAVLRRYSRRGRATWRGFAGFDRSLELGLSLPLHCTACSERRNRRTRNRAPDHR